jgi:hypothetical protein
LILSGDVLQSGYPLEEINRILLKKVDGEGLCCSYCCFWAASVWTRHASANLWGKLSKKQKNFVAKQL